MKKINTYITEKLKIKKSSYKYFPKTKEELKDLLKQLIEERGNEGDFNDIDVSNVTDMNSMFYDCYKFNQSLNDWDVSNVINMADMFYWCESFNQDISEWDVSNVTDMRSMFGFCKSFNYNISNWDVSNVTDMRCMFLSCESFNQDISNWDVSNVKYGYNENMFANCSIEKKYTPKFK